MYECVCGAAARFLCQECLHRAHVCEHIYKYTRISRSSIVSRSFCAWRRRATNQRALNGNKRCTNHEDDDDDAMISSIKPRSAHNTTKDAPSRVFTLSVVVLWFDFCCRWCGLFVAAAFAFATSFKRCAKTYSCRKCAPRAHIRATILDCCRNTHLYTTTTHRNDMGPTHGARSLIFSRSAKTKRDNSRNIAATETALCRSLHSPKQIRPIIDDGTRQPNNIISIKSIYIAPNLVCGGRNMGFRLHYVHFGECDVWVVLINLKQMCIIPHSRFGFI